jgi:hypothetical protein
MNYNLACLYALLGSNAEKDPRMPAAERTRLLESYVTQSLAWLKCGADSGFFKDRAIRDHARKDPDLAIVRGRAEFQKLIESPGDKR